MDSYSDACIMPTPVNAGQPSVFDVGFGCVSGSGHSAPGDRILGDRNLANPFTTTFDHHHHQHVAEEERGTRQVAVGPSVEGIADHGGEGEGA